jgi:hypothetical protein
MLRRLEELRTTNAALDSGAVRIRLYDSSPTG